jgi:hypothetical protein
VKRKLYPLLDSLGLERGGRHAFRHTNSTLMDQLSVPLKVRQQRLGDSDPSLTLGRYTRCERGSEGDCFLSRRFVTKQVSHASKAIAFQFGLSVELIDRRIPRLDLLPQHFRHCAVVPVLPAGNLEIKDVTFGTSNLFSGLSSELFWVW